ncbi:hypothetical protein SPRG_03519 [Saprolegnia parasitica CBS 223.65]|uniref:Uncharacterized protein n=1 Tax=Saprolegnia parasitica (strain CBS 223.65) TaxID=695850 RepID=A0A067CQS5_SAPPC|nr:hypothetical protein SPRG_03519 [Saprolegnia parasitica CBS 223.65]KDO31590.1 hypothetical protein SPRG_03519 [Saprolegnia parasitica CBS 223.65]|eukprot:XP_012197490.1 hypothetical protein SPRG_03519 [Saprolegnia parasitica CBS 223.65]
MSCLVVLSNADLVERVLAYQPGVPLAARAFIAAWKQLGLPHTVSDYASKVGDVAMLRRLASCGHGALTPKAMDWAAMHGHIDAVRYLHETRHAACTVDALDQAAKNGHLGVVKYLCKERSEGCTSNGYLWAASHGHVDIIVVLSAHHPHQQWNGALAIERATAAGHVAMVQWLLPRQSPLTLQSVLKIAVYHGHVAILQLLLRSGP